MEREPQRCRFKAADQLNIVIAQLVICQAIVLFKLVINFVDGVSDLVKLNLRWAGEVELHKL